MTGWELIVCGLVLVAATAIGAKLLFSATRLAVSKQTWVTAVGVVEESGSFIDWEGTARAFVRYRFHVDERLHFGKCEPSTDSIPANSPAGSSLPSYSVGSEVRIIFDPDNPDRNCPDDSRGIEAIKRSHLIFGCIILFGVVILLHGLGWGMIWCAITGSTSIR